MATGDPELWLMDAQDGSNKRQLTFRKGFDGRASFTEDGRKIIYEATPTPTTDKELLSYETALRRPRNVQQTKPFIFDQSSTTLNLSHLYNPSSAKFASNDRIIFMPTTENTILMEVGSGAVARDVVINKATKKVAFASSERFVPLALFQLEKNRALTLFLADFIEPEPQPYLEAKP
uniref:Dipeptidylpeptidase IV N-terminal domain-containing protein n=1 Tax=Ditylenchus dipsaci TaxID=166011 RepID=A0A915E177_9BILA